MPACWALHGQVFDTDEPMGTHPVCRRAMMPVTRNLGPPPSGPDEFARLDPVTQREILGPAAHRAYEAGDLDLADLVRTRTSPQWVITRSRGSLVDAVGPERGPAVLSGTRGIGQQPSGWSSPARSYIRQTKAS